MIRPTYTRFFRTVAALVATFGIVSGPVMAQGAADLNISPKRVVFSGTNRSTLVYVFNRGTAPASYAVDLSDRVMLPDGQILSISEVPAEQSTAKETAGRVKSAKAMLTYTPRRVTLGPGESQVIRVRLLPPPGLASGEYRSHLTVATLPPEDVGVTAEQAAQLGEGELAVKVVSLLALSIPVIVRQDVTAGKPTIEALKLGRVVNAASDQPPAYLSLDLARSGVGSVYGSFEILVDKGRGKPEQIGALKGIAVYPEIDRRSIRLNLTRTPVAGEKLVVRFVDETDAGPGAVLATTTLDVR